jgi:aldose 1-epimerase
MTSKQVTIMLIALSFCCIIGSCNSGQKVKYAPGLVLLAADDFDAELDGQKTSLFTLQNANGMRVDITNYGGKIVSIIVPDKDGVFDDVVTGYRSINEYLRSGEPYFGAIIGRYGNRIGNATFTIDEKQYQLPINNGPNHLHGGDNGFHTVVWTPQLIDDKTLKLTYLSKHLEEGYPGDLRTEVTYALTDANELVITYNATTDRKTHVNLTNHAFFNLDGEGSKTINNHKLKINALSFTPVDADLIPTGEVLPVKDTPFDFTEYNTIGARVDDEDTQLEFGKGYDHNFVLNRATASELEFAASVYSPETGRMMEVLTTEPGIQFYGGNFLTGSETGKRGEPYTHRSSFCLETQHFPNSPNQLNFPSTLLNPGETYFSQTIYRFTLKK